MENAIVSSGPTQTEEFRHRVIWKHSLTWARCACQSFFFFLLFLFLPSTYCDTLAGEKGEPRPLVMNDGRRLKTRDANERSHAKAAALPRSSHAHSAIPHAALRGPAS